MSDLAEIREAFDAAVEDAADRPASAVRSVCLLLRDNRVLRERLAVAERSLDTAVSMLAADLEAA